MAACATSSDLPPPPTGGNEQPGHNPEPAVVDLLAALQAHVATQRPDLDPGQLGHELQADQRLADRLQILLAGGWRPKTLTEELGKDLADAQAPVCVLRARAERRRPTPPGGRPARRCAPDDPSAPASRPASRPAADAGDERHADDESDKSTADDAVDRAAALLADLDDATHQRVLADVSAQVALSVAEGTRWGDVHPWRQALLAPHLVTHLHGDSPPESPAPAADKEPTDG